MRTIRTIDLCIPTAIVQGMRLNGELAEQRADMINTMVRAGLSYADIGKSFRISRGRVWQIFRKYRRKASKHGRKLCT